MNKQTLVKGTDMLNELNEYLEHKRLFLESFEIQKQLMEKQVKNRKEDDRYVEPMFTFARCNRGTNDPNYGYSKSGRRVSLLPDFCNHEDIAILYLARLDNHITMLTKKFDNFQIIDELPD